MTLDKPSCDLQASGTIELYFYDELNARERAAVDRHLTACRTCLSALQELAVIRDALATRPDVSAPPAGDWSGFMARLDRAVRSESRVRGSFGLRARDARDQALQATSSTDARRSLVPYLAMAALLALVAASVSLVWRTRQAVVPPPDAVLTATTTPSAATQAATDPNASLVALSEQHLERSKLVVLGLATKDAHHAGPQDWTYERQLATSLLSDTRMYRLAAEDHGMDGVARVMRDLELVLLQASLSEDSDPALAQIQRLIQKRDLLGRMNVVNTTGL